MNAQAISAHSISYIESMHAKYLRDANAVPSDWRHYFSAVEDVSGGGPHDYSVAEPYKKDETSRGVEDRGGATLGEYEFRIASLQDRIDQLVRAYRVRGHMIARLDPLGSPREPQPELDPGHYGLTDADLARPVSARTVGGGVRIARNIVECMRNTYCRAIGVQFMHIDDLSIRHWLQDRMESSQNHIHLDVDEQVRVLTLLTRAVIFEEFVRKKYVGAKSFSLEGCESLIPLLDIAIEKAAEHGVDEIVMGMAHRGRLNVLVNVLNKRMQDVFREFEDVDPERYSGGGDIKYHLGHSSDRITSCGRPVHLSLCFNPSHLEFVNPVALGRVRAKQDRWNDAERRRATTILIHGDASFPGEGIVQESLNLSEIKAYRTGGTIHVIVNNQLGFTTSPKEGRSSLYATGVAKMLQIPIFHVNGEDPVAVAQTITLAMDFRSQFRRDAVIDMYGYRRWGHNEGDEPAFTQPLMYQAIEKRQSVRDSYLENVLKLGGMTADQAASIETRCREDLERELTVARSEEYAPRPTARGIWEGYRGGPDSEVPDSDTTVPSSRLIAILEALSTIPASFNLHPRLKKLLERRAEMAKGERPLDWPTAEALAFATLAAEGFPVRLSGQDTARGTFSQRHAVLHDVEDGSTYEPLMHIEEGQAPVRVYNSPLSEAAVLGFEYGYSLDTPEGLVLWEAQFGDFVNAAQVVIDQFIASAENKWQRLSGIVLLLPHGLEGQGPEHASARLERFLVLAAKDNMQIVNLTTPSQYFHVLRRQVLRRWRKPLIVMAPKRLLRLPAAASNLDDLADGAFRRVIGDASLPGSAVRRVLLCSGKIYYDLVERREKLESTDIAIIRVEQLYPFPANELKESLKGFDNAATAYWVQEEPENMGAWRYLRMKSGDRLPGGLRLRDVCRPESASPGTGSLACHRLEQEHLLDRAFADRREGA